MQTSAGSDRKTLIEAMGEIEDGQKWWTLKEIRRLLKDLGWIGTGPDQLRGRDFLSLLSLAFANQLLEARFNDAIGENEFRVNKTNENA